MVIVKKGEVARKNEKAEADKTRKNADHAKAVTDYNIMMGVLEDPAEEEEDG